MRTLMTVLFLVPLAAFSSGPKFGSLEGVVESGGTVLGTVTLTVKNNVFERTVTVNGNFSIAKIPAGSFSLLAEAEGFDPQRIDVTIKAGEATQVKFNLEPATLSLSQVAVAPSTFSIMNRQAASVSYLDRETINNTPHFGGDPLRALGTLPGTSSNDFGASFNIRGGEYREVLVTLDGMELTNPFHLKDFSGVFSYFDSEILGGLNLSTGGFDARYGNALSAVMEVDTLTPTNKSSSLNLSFGNLGFQTEGTFAGGLGSYLFSARRGYLDLLLSFTDDDEEEEEGEQDITYYDSYGKIRYLLSDNQALTLSYMLAGDDFLANEIEEGEIEDTDSSYRDFYLWANLRSSWSPNLTSETTLYWSDLTQDRIASSIEPSEGYSIVDNRTLESVGIKTDFEYSSNDRFLWRFGAEMREVKAEYTYTSELQGDPIGGLPLQEPIDIFLRPEGREMAAYITSRMRLSDKLVAEVGLRYDDQEILDDSQVSPRFNLAYETDRSGTWRFAYGVYHQAERAHDLQVADGVTTFSQPERADHWLLGWDYRFANGLDLRLEGYYKDLQNLRTRYENLTRSLVIYPGTGRDRVQLPVTEGTIHGLEAVLKQDLGGKFSWFLNYAWSQAEDKTADGVTIPRQWEQEHTLNLNANYRPGSKWNFNASWIYHSGWRTTPLDLVSDGAGGFNIVPGEIFSDRFPAYHRLDVRINRNVYRNNKRAFQLYLDINNLYNRKNIRGYEDFRLETDASGNTVIASEQEDWLPILPTFGLTWKF